MPAYLDKAYSVPYAGACNSRKLAIRSTTQCRVVRAVEAMWQAADLGGCHGGIMRVKRALIPVILVLGTAGAILGGSAVPMLAAQASSSHVAVVAASGGPDTVYHW